MTATTTTATVDFAPVPTDHGWLRDLRAAAGCRFADVGIPSPESDDWRHSRIADLDLGRFLPAGPPASGDFPGDGVLRPLVDAIAPFSRLAVTHGGWLVHTDGDGAGAPGLAVRNIADDDRAPDGWEELPGPDAFADLNASQSPAPILVATDAGAAIANPVVLTHWAGRDLAATFPRTLIHAGRGSELTVVEIWSSADIDALIVPRTEIVAESDSIVRHVVISDNGPRVWQIGSLTARVGAGASVTSSAIALGGEYSRFRIDADLRAGNGEARLFAAYFGDEQQVHDFRTLQDHTGKNTSSNLTFKGAVGGSARAVYSGLIRVNPGASGTSAFLTNRNLVLSPDAGAYSVPNLEIVNENDLRSCGHAATSGPIDPDQVFYLESRGVPTDVARRLIVLGFFDDVLSRVPVPGLAEFVRERVSVKLANVIGVR